MAAKSKSRSKRSQQKRAWAAVFALLLVMVAFFYWQWQASQNAAPDGQANLHDDGPVYGGEPRMTDGDTIKVLRNLGYVVGYSEARKDPRWVAYRLVGVPETTQPRPQHAFHSDLRTSAQVRNEDYTNSGYDRGHMAPNRAIVECFGTGAQFETFLMSNICPQKHELNIGPWEKLETRELESYAKTYGTVWIFDGPIFDDNPRKLPNGTNVPRAFYKIIARDAGGGPNGGTKLLAFIMPQEAGDREQPQKYLSSVQEVERESHIDFFWQLGKSTEDALEAEQPVGMW